MFISIIAATDPCEGDNNQCNGNGECVTTTVATKEYTCICYDGWSGQFCQGMFTRLMYKSEKFTLSRSENNLTLNE